MKKEIIEEFPKRKIPTQTIINDYCFICFLLGNDFIKHSPSLILRYDGLYHILNTYKQCCQENSSFYLINTKTKGIIHWNNFIYFIDSLAKNENDRMKDIHKIRLKQHYKYKRIYDDIHKNKDTVKMNKTNSFPVEDIMRHKPIIFMNDEKYIFEKKDQWINRYNTFLLTDSHKMFPVNELNDKVNELCKEYVKSLVWTSHYYFNECISQEWYYPYEYSPTLCDLSKYLKNNKRVKITSHSKPYTPLEQLQFVFPKQSYCLSSELDDSGLDEFTGFKKTHNLLKRYDWECEPIFDSH